MERVNQTYPNSITQAEDVERYYTGNIYSTYLFNIRENHKFKFLLGYQFELSNSQFVGGRRFDLVSQSTPSFSTATGDVRIFDSKGHYATEGVFTRLNYDYNNKYLFEINARYDGTSRFAVGDRYGLFPSLSAGWNIHMEDFWEPIKNTVNEFKLRASWGQLGNHNVPSYQDLPLIGIQSNLNWLIQGNRPAFVTAPNLTSANLTWETAETINFGLDIGLIDNRLMASFDMYERTTKDMLGPAQALPATLGANQPNANNATLRTRGWELSLSWRNVINRDLNYSARLVLSDYEDVVTDFYNPNKSLTTFYEGMVLGEIWGYETEGLFKSQEEIENHADQSFLFGDWNTGDVKYRDLNGDGVINRGDNTVDNPGDRRIIGNSTPRYQFGIDLNLQFKNFQFSTFWQGTAKRDAAVGRPNASWYFGFRSPVQNNLFTNHLDYYRDQEETKYAGLGQNTDAFFPRPYQNGRQNRKNQQVQTRFTENAAYIRLKHAQIRYNVPSNLSQRVGITDASIYVTGENLLTFTSLQKGFDPDTAGLGQFGVGKSHFLQRTFALGLDLSF
ncbi:MAG: SusC/RagA family TonB-linked outer membrane protein [Balneolaceae bacterium]|nr:SusC/RagA family TonB-linked outer membrane protein [Balneolaceae bacterium]